MEHKKIGIFGGSFDPIHLGHLHFARQLQNRLALDEIWFIPARISPHKLDTPPAPLQDRVQMMELALAPYPSFILKNIESQRTTPSYTIDTIKELRENFPDHQFFLLLGADTVQDFDKWNRFDEIARLCQVIVASRAGIDDALFAPFDNKNHNFHYLTVPILDISSSKIRKLRSLKKNTEHLLPPSVNEYIVTRQLYIK